jgi:hypothetical protein
MRESYRNWWWWTRGILAVLLATLLVATALPSAGRIVVDHTGAARPHVVWGVRECSPSIGLALAALVCIFVGMSKRWDFEIVGWAILVVFILASGMG